MSITNMQACYVYESDKFSVYKKVGILKKKKTRAFLEQNSIDPVEDSID